MHEGHEGISIEAEAAARGIVGAALVVHRTLGPGLLETAYETCLADELEECGHRVDRQLSLPIKFKGKLLEGAYRIDLLIDNSVIIEVKAVESIIPIHEAQLLTYLRLSGQRLGFLINFNTILIKHGIHRMVV
jgi:GxxExxY protein